jgi:putative N6-adenine-specific DNA methylase
MKKTSARDPGKNDQNSIHAIVTCPDETKEVLANELRALGARDIDLRYRAVACSVPDLETFYELHLKLRTASRIFRVVKEFAAKDEKMLADQARRIRWSEFFLPERTFIVEGVPADRGPGVMGSNTISKTIREALQASFAQHTGKTPKVDLKEPKVVVVAFVQKGRCTLSFDTTGKTLHKRGYRTEGHPAPIKETLACAILDLAGYDGTQALLDPMCGSGTIAIEAAYKALRKAAHIHRKKGEFGFEWLKDFDNNVWRKVQDRVRGERLESLPAPIVASDISPKYVDMARQNALRARVERDIEFKTGKIEDARPHAETGILIANLPYGARLATGEVESLTKLYGEIGDNLKQNFKGWRAALLAAEESPWKFIGLKPTRKFNLMNGSIKAKLLIFDIYAGSKKKRPADE